MKKEKRKVASVNGTALAAGVCQHVKRQTPVASAIPLTNATPPDENRWRDY